MVEHSSAPTFTSNSISGFTLYDSNFSPPTRTFLKGSWYIGFLVASLMFNWKEDRWIGAECSTAVFRVGIWDPRKLCFMHEQEVVKKGNSQGWKCRDTSSIFSWMNTFSSFHTSSFIPSCKGWITERNWWNRWIHTSWCIVNLQLINRRNRSEKCLFITFLTIHLLFQSFLVGYTCDCMKDTWGMKWHSNTSQVIQQ